MGPDAYLFHEQWVVKGAEQGMKFSWHQDSGYVKWYDPTTNHKPYVTCWCTLDAVNEENGTVYILPHSRAGTRDKIIDHLKEEGSNDLIGYTGSDPGDPLIVPAGSIVAFDSFVFHRSGPNTTNRMRRIYLPAIQRRTDQASRRQALGDGHAVSQGRQEHLRPRRRYRRRNTGRIPTKRKKRDDRRAIAKIAKAKTGDARELFSASLAVSWQ